MPGHEAAQLRGQPPHDLCYSLQRVNLTVSRNVSPLPSNVWQRKRLPFLLCCRSYSITARSWPGIAGHDCGASLLGLTLRCNANCPGAENGSRPIDPLRLIGPLAAPLGGHAMPVAWKQRRLADIRKFEESGQPALEADCKAAVGRHAVFEGVEISRERLGAETTRG